MCLDILWSDEKTNKWLRDKPDVIFAYKVVSVVNGNVYPPMFATGHGLFCRTNKIGKNYCPSLIETVVDQIGLAKRKTYRAYYHVFADSAGAIGWRGSREQILKCVIEKNQVTDIGIQNGHVVIITKKFTFIDGKTYFGE